MKDWHEKSLASRDGAVLSEKLSHSVAYAHNIFVGEYRISTFPSVMNIRLVQSS